MSEQSSRPDPTEEPTWAPFTRRRLLASTGAAAVSAGVVGGLAPTAGALPSWLSRASYARRIGHAFTATPAGGAATWLKLAAIEDLLGTSPRGTTLARRDDAFLLRFARTSGPGFAQGPVELRNKDLGRTTLFVVPGRITGTYVLVVNRTP